jgi:hypothetical protein
VNDYLLHEMVRVRTDELRAEAARAREARGSQERRRYVRMLGVWATPHGEAGGFSGGTIEQACCA